MASITACDFPEQMLELHWVTRRPLCSKQYNEIISATVNVNCIVSYCTVCILGAMAFINYNNWKVLAFRVVYDTHCGIEFRTRQTMNKT